MLCKCLLCILSKKTHLFLYENDRKKSWRHPIKCLAKKPCRHVTNRGKIFCCKKTIFRVRQPAGKTRDAPALWTNRPGHGLPCSSPDRQRPGRTESRPLFRARPEIACKRLLPNPPGMVIKTTFCVCGGNVQRNFKIHCKRYRKACIKWP